MKTMKKLSAVAAFSVAVWLVWPSPAETKTVKAVTTIVAPATRVATRHAVAKKPSINNETEAALNKLGLTLENSVGVSVTSAEK